MSRYTKSERLSDFIDYSPLRTNEAKRLLEYQDKKSNFKPVSGDTYIGIEVEVEKIIAPFPENGFKFWQCVPDGSLRNNGQEYVSQPMRGKLIGHALDELHTWLTQKNSKHDFSVRTSVHVHMNARHMSVEEIVNFILTYSLVEPFFYEFSKKYTNDRIANNFCVPISHAQNALNLPGMIKEFEAGNKNNAIRVMTNNWKKYTGFNLLPLGGAGTIEFRQLGGTIDLKVLHTWINMIFSLKKFSCSVSYKGLKNRISRLNYSSEYQALFYEIFTIPEIQLEFPIDFIIQTLEDSSDSLKQIFISHEESLKLFSIKKPEYSPLMKYLIDKQLIADLSSLLKQIRDIEIQIEKMEAEIVGKGEAAFKTPLEKEKWEAKWSALQTEYRSLKKRL